MTKGVPLVPSPEQRNQVEMLAGFGVPQHQIAVLLVCDLKTLRKHCGGWRHGLPMLLAEGANGLAREARRGDLGPGWEAVGTDGYHVLLGRRSRGADADRPKHGGNDRTR